MEYLDDEAGEYSTFAYYAPDRRFGTPADFQNLVNELHKENIWCDPGLDTFAFSKN